MTGLPTHRAYAHRRIDYDDLRQRWDGPLTTTQLGAMYGVSASSVSGAAKKMGLTPRPRGIRAAARMDLAPGGPARDMRKPPNESVNALSGGAWLPRGGRVVWVPGGTYPAGSVLRDEAS